MVILAGTIILAVLFSILGGSPFQNHALHTGIQIIKLLHGPGVHQDFRNLRSRANKLQYVSVVLWGSSL